MPVRMRAALAEVIESQKVSCPCRATLASSDRKSTRNRRLAVTGHGIPGTRLNRCDLLSYLTGSTLLLSLLEGFVDTTHVFLSRDRAGIPDCRKVIRPRSCNPSNL